MKPHPDKIRVLVANEPRSYREVIAQFLGELLPDVEFVTSDPSDLEVFIHHLLPSMVLCSEAPAAVRDNVLSWVELYPEQGSRSFVSIRGEREVVEDIQISDLVSIVKQTALQAH